MNHFLGLIVLALAVALIFTLITKENQQERIRYFLRILVYMIIGSLLAAWVMWLIP